MSAAEEGALAHKREAQSWTIGRCYMVHTVSPIYTGRLVGMTPTELVFEDAAWIPDTGRLNECLRKGSVVECEPFDTELILPRASIMAAQGWEHDLPRKVR